MKRRSMKRVNAVKNNIKPFKTLAVATIAGLSFIGVGQAQAATLDEVDLSQNRLILQHLIIYIITMFKSKMKTELK